MASTLILVTGGCRSGKSSQALRLAERRGGGKIFLATSPILDAETAERVRRHRDERAGRGWTTLEEQVDLARAVAGTPPGATILVDCLTLWINNLLHRAESVGRPPPGEDEVSALADELAAACRAREGLTVLVANEVGLGIVPENALARRFRDLAGRANQAVAAAADEVYFMVSGVAMRIK